MVSQKPYTALCGLEADQIGEGQQPHGMILSTGRTGLLFINGCTLLTMQNDEEISTRDFIAMRIESVTRLVESLSELTDAKFVTFRTLIDSQAEKVALALAAADKAVAKAETATEKRFEAVNEFRAQLADQAATLASRREVEASELAMSLRLTDIDKRLTALTTRIDTSEGKSKGVSASFAGLVTAIGAVVVIVNLMIYLFTR